MKKILTALVAAGALMGGYSASAIQYSDTDLVLAYVSTSAAYKGNFNIAQGDFDALDIGQSGYNPNTQTILSATAAFTFQDLNLTDNTFTITLTLDPQAPTFLSGGISPIQASFNGPIVGSAYVTLNANGSLDYTVQLTSGAPVMLVMATLRADVGDKVIGVPDGGMTLGLLGSSLLAGCWVCRRLRIGSVR